MLLLALFLDKLFIENLFLFSGEGLLSIEMLFDLFFFFLISHEILKVQILFSDIKNKKIILLNLYS